MDNLDEAGTSSISHLLNPVRIVPSIAHPAKGSVRPLLDRQTIRDNLYVEQEGSNFKSLRARERISMNSE